MKNSRLFKKYAPFLALMLLFSNACFCWETAAPAAPQAKMLPPPTAIGPTPTMVKTHELSIPDPDICSIQWVLPGGAGYVGELPKTGKTAFEWTQHPDANSYELVVTQPDGTTIPYKSDGATKNLYMENYKQAGEYLVTLSALDANNQIICSVNLTFNKPAVDPKADGGGGGGISAPGPVIVIPVDDVPR